jgi:CheY-like chemotaxis protein
VQKILVVEDYQEVCDFFAMALTDHAHFEVITAGNGNEAISLLELQHPDLALIDVQIPGEVQGIEISERALALDVPVVLMTGDFAMSDRLTENRIPHFLKPFPVSELFEAIDKGLVLSAENCRVLRASLAQLRASMEALKMAHQEAARTAADSRREREDRQANDKAGRK